jgi:drug/metabolite transporter (DMT)-like permease
VSSIRAPDALRLVALAIVWSLSFVFIRVIVAPLGPVWTATLRMLIAGVALCAFFALVGFHADARRHWRAYLFIGTLNRTFRCSPGPPRRFPRLSRRAERASPMFSALLAALWLDEHFPIKVAGLSWGSGVAMVSGAPRDVTGGRPRRVASLAALATRWRNVARAPRRSAPKAIAGWSQLFAGPRCCSPGVPDPRADHRAVAANLAALASCSAVAYLLYFLIRDIGPRAMTVTFLMPALGMLGWCSWRTRHAAMPGGAALVVAGTFAVLRPARGGPRRRRDPRTV